MSKSKVMYISVFSGGHLCFIQYGRQRGRPACLPAENERYIQKVTPCKKLCFGPDVNDFLVKPPY